MESVICYKCDQRGHYATQFYNIKKLRTTGLEKKFGQITREDNKIKIKTGLDDNENEKYLHFVRKWYENKSIKYKSNEQDETIRKKAGN